MKRHFAIGRGAVLVVLVLLAGSFFYGYLCHKLELPPYTAVRSASQWARERPPFRQILVLLQKAQVSQQDRPAGDWVPVARGGGPAGDAEREKLLAKMQTIGYLSAYEKATGLEDVTVYVPELAYEGLNLYTSGHAEVAYLMNMQGENLHEWTYRFRDAFPEFHDDTGLPEPDHWRRVHLFSNGDILAVYDGVGLVKLDKDSNLIWKSNRGAHHDLFVADDGVIYVLTRQAKVIPRIDEFEPVLEDFITVFDADGNVLRELSLLEAFENSSFASFLKNMPPYGDIFHTNTIEVLDGRHADRSPAFAAGNVLVSVREIDVIAIVDMDEKSVVWALSGQWKAQHQPTMLDNGNMLLFDNQGYHGGSKVIEFDPLTQQIVWAYEGTEENGFHSSSLGSCQRLPNGNTLITESKGGRAFEVVPDKTIVWEFYNPARSGENNELIGALYEVVRLAPDFPADWADNP
jgi:hypothetical protein